MPQMPNFSDSLEFHAETPEGLPVWKTKGVALTSENLIENVFVLSVDIAQCFVMRHNNLLRNIRKLQREKVLPERLLKVEQPYESGNSTRLTRLVYALTRHQAYHLLMDFAGAKARTGKHAIVSRLESIERDLLKDAYSEAKRKASTWDGTELLLEFGLVCSAPNRIATKSDIVKFLKVPESNLNYFLRKHSDEIKPVRLGFATVRAMGGMGRYMHGYPLGVVLKIVCGMETEVSMAFRKRMFGDVAMFAKPHVRTETEWRPFLERIFDGLNPLFNYPIGIGNYRVDCFVEKPMLVLECNGYDCHRHYDQKKEAEREKAISAKYRMVRFHHKVSVEALFNGILRAEVGSVVRLYDPGHLVKS